MGSPFLLVDALAAIAFFSLAYQWLSRKSALPLPPGPPRLPLVGNAFDIPRDYPWKQYDKLSEKYGASSRVYTRLPFLIVLHAGDVISLEVFGQIIIVINSLPALKDIVLTRSATFSGRPYNQFAKMYAGSFILDVVYGYDVTSREDHFIKINEELLSVLPFTILPGALIVNTLPIPAIDTTVSSLMAIILCMILNPHVQVKAREELDRVIGRERIPVFDDRPNLPYMEAVFMEALRWDPTGPLDEDVLCENFYIPKGAIVLANVWAILHDPVQYPEPHVFKPERFLSPEGRIVNDPNLEYAFGFGTRKCPGRHFADATLWLYMTSILVFFEISKATDANGKEIPVDGKFESQSVIQYAASYPSWSAFFKNTDQLYCSGWLEASGLTLVQAIEGSVTSVRLNKDIQRQEKSRDFLQAVENT
ncbi:cytochrome P450 [Vararia minispora EC-137]|uniref:Cytochrome P450 n=1 Tax=Vararia minispora EC-137 TaxID=1314806 RepID=A0ACB8QBY9_9AGAM|nr:cytochrome P450 [Vararia minispora EC-137]